MKALLLVDIQNDFCSGGALEVKNGDEVVEVANKLIEIFSKKNKLIIATKDFHPKNHKSFAINSNKKIGEIGTLNGIEQVFWPVHCVENTVGSDFHKNLRTDKIDKTIYKGTNSEVDSYSGFFENDKKSKTELDTFLKNNNVDTLYILGLATDYCVKFTVLDALDLGYKVFLIKDGCRAISENELAIDEMKKIGAKIIYSDEIEKDQNF